VMDTSFVIARAHVPQDQAALMKQGDVATIIAPGNDDVKGKVTLVSPATDPNSTTVEMWVEAPNKNGVLRPGTSVQLEILVRTVPDAITVPAAAVLKNAEGGSTVIVVGSDGRAHETPVDVGIRSGDEVQIAKGVNAGETVVATGAYGLPNNTRVQPAQASAEDKEGKPGAAEKE
jgi:HlyD family secretion protein